MKNANIYAALYCAHKCGVSIEAIEHFSKIVNTGLQEDGNQTAPILLRNYLLNNSVKDTNVKKIIFRATQEALRDFVNKVRRNRPYTGKTATYATVFADAFRSGSLYENTGNDNSPEEDK